MKTGLPSVNTTTTNLSGTRDENGSKNIASLSFCERVASFGGAVAHGGTFAANRVERREAEKLGRLMNDPVGKAFTFAMVDEVFRSRNSAVVAGRWRGLLRAFGVPRFMPMTDRFLMRVGAWASYCLPES